jgi:hypothetical protein
VGPAAGDEVRTWQPPERAWPRRPWDEVHPGLFIGGARFKASLSRFDVVVTLTEPWEGTLPVPPGVLDVRLVLADYEGVEPDREAVDALAADIASWVRDGRRVLVRCWAGMNRSGYVTARALVALGLTGPQAVDAIRAARSDLCLCNPTLHALAVDAT